MPKPHGSTPRNPVCSLGRASSSLIMRGIAIATGSHLWIIHGLLMRAPIRKITKSPSMRAAMRSAMMGMNTSSRKIQKQGRTLVKVKAHVAPAKTRLQHGGGDGQEAVADTVPACSFAVARGEDDDCDDGGSAGSDGRGTDAASTCGRRYGTGSSKARV